MKETTEERYWEMLGVLPPEKMIGNDFLMGEPVTTNAGGYFVFDAYFKVGEKYLTKPMTLAEFIDFKNPA